MVYSSEKLVILMKKKFVIKEFKIISFVVICLVIIVIGASYALFFQVTHNTTNQVVKAGSLEFHYDKGTLINSDENARCFAPTNYEKSQVMAECMYHLGITNSGTLASTYKLSLINNPDTTLELNKVKIIMKRQNEDNSLIMLPGFPKRLSDMDDDVLITDEIFPGKNTLYTLQLYIDEDVSSYLDQGKKLSLTINGFGEVSENLDINGELVS